MIDIYCYCPVKRKDNYYILVQACNTESDILERPNQLQEPSPGCDDDDVEKKRKSLRRTIVYDSERIVSMD
jgi:hypothetical protein